MDIPGLEFINTCYIAQSDLNLGDFVGHLELCCHVLLAVGNFCGVAGECSTTSFLNSVDFTNLLHVTLYIEHYITLAQCACFSIPII